MARKHIIERIYVASCRLRICEVTTELDASPAADNTSQGLEKQVRMSYIVGQIL